MAETATKGKNHIGLVIVGHVDAGKSTTTGRLLFELGGIPEREMEKLREEAKAEKKESFAFAYFMDRSKEERKRGVTIACTTKEFHTKNFHFTIIDAPGHKDFIKNMISGASQADVALLLVPASKGGFETAIKKGSKAGEVKGQTRHHAELTSLLGIRQIIVGVNKMDNTSPKPYLQARFDEIASEMRRMLAQSGWKSSKTCPVIPISGWMGDNITSKSAKMPWYKGFNSVNDDGKVSGHTLVDAFNDYVLPVKRATGKKFRMPVSGVYKIKGVGDVITGRIEQGELVPSTIVKNIKKPTDIIFHPMGIKAAVNTIEMHHKSQPIAHTGDNVGINVKGLKKGEMPKAGDVMALANDDTIGNVEEFTCVVKVQDHGGELKSADGNAGKGYCPLVMVRTAKAPCLLKSINWKLSRKSMKAIAAEKNKKRKKELSKEMKETNAKMVKKGASAEVTFRPLQSFCVTSFKNCEGLGRIAVLEANALVMLGKVTSVKLKAKEEAK